MLSVAYSGGGVKPLKFTTDEASEPQRARSRPSVTSSTLPRGDPTLGGGFGGLRQCRPATVSRSPPSHRPLYFAAASSALRYAVARVARHPLVDQLVSPGLRESKFPLALTPRQRSASKQNNAMSLGYRASSIRQELEAGQVAGRRVIPPAAHRST